LTTNEKYNANKTLLSVLFYHLSATSGA